MESVLKSSQSCPDWEWGIFNFAHYWLRPAPKGFNSLELPASLVCGLAYFLTWKRSQAESCHCWWLETKLPAQRDMDGHWQHLLQHISMMCPFWINVGLIKFYNMIHFDHQIGPEECCTNLYIISVLQPILGWPCSVKVLRINSYPLCIFFISAAVKGFFLNLFIGIISISFFVHCPSFTLTIFLWERSSFKIYYILGVPVMVQQKWIWVVSMKMHVWSLASLSGSGIWHYPELWCSLQTWLRFRVAVAMAPIWPLAWELPYATGAALKSPKINKKIKFTIFLCVADIFPGLFFAF